MRRVLEETAFKLGSVRLGCRLTLIFAFFVTGVVNQAHRAPAKQPLLRNLQSRQRRKLVKRFLRFNDKGERSFTEFVMSPL